MFGKCSCPGLSSLPPSAEVVVAIGSKANGRRDARRTIGRIHKQAKEEKWEEKPERNKRTIHGRDHITTGSCRHGEADEVMIKERCAGLSYKYPLGRLHHKSLALEHSKVRTILYTTSNYYILYYTHKPLIFYLYFISRNSSIEFRKGLLSFKYWQDGRAVQGAGVRFQSRKGRGFKSHSCH